MYACRRHILHEMMRSNSQMRRGSDTLNRKRRDHSCVRKIQRSNGLEEYNWSIPLHNNRIAKTDEHEVD